MWNASFGLITVNRTWANCLHRFNLSQYVSTLFKKVADLVHQQLSQLPHWLSVQVNTKII